MGRNQNKPHRPRPGSPPPADDARSQRPHPQHAKVRISFEYYEAGGRYCLCHHETEHIKTFLECLRKLTERTWQQLLEGSSKNPASKSGLNCTTYERTDLTNPDIWPARLGADITTLYGVRATDRRRVFGIRVDSAFYVIWFDEGHGIVPG